MSNFSSNIKINGVVYNQSNLEQLRVANEPSDSWRNLIYQFLQNWYNDSDHVIAQTSGSTGKPKAINLSKAGMRNSARMTNHFFGLTSSKTALLCLPANYIAGKMMLVRALMGGFNLIVVEPVANPFEKLEVEVNFVAITPYQLIHSAETLRTKNVEQIIVGGSGVSSQLEALAADIPAQFFETYGMTETYSHIALRRFNGAHKSDCFTVLNGIYLRLDERRCLVVSAPHLFDEEMVTNDIVELIDEKRFRWMGRADTVINSGGVKIHPEQVEHKLKGVISSPFFISSVPDKELVNKVVLVIESKVIANSQLDEMKSKMESVLDRYEIPKQVLFLPEFIYSKSNKVMRNESIHKALLFFDENTVF